MGRYHAEAPGRPGADDSGKPVWTGTNRLGRAWGYGDLRFFAGARERVWVGNPRSTTGGGIVYAPDEPGYLPPTRDQNLPLYGISPVITVQPPVWEATLTVDGMARTAHDTGSCEPGQMLGCQRPHRRSLLGRTTVAHATTLHL